MFQVEFIALSLSTNRSIFYTMSDNTPLLPGANPNPMGRRKILTTILVPVLLLAGVIFISIRGDGVPKEPLDRAKYWLKK